MIIFQASAGENVGIGNVVRTMEIAKYIKEHTDTKIKLIYECEKRIIENLDFKGLDVVISQNRNESFDIINKIDEEITIVSDLVDINIIDKKFYEEKKVKSIIHINDNNLELLEPDIFINSDIFKQKFSLNKKTKVFYGKDFLFVRSDIANKRPKKFIPIKYVENILICFGSADPGEFTEVLLEIIKKKKLFKYNYRFIVGSSFPKHRVNKLKEMHIKNVEFIFEENNMGKRILEADVVLTLGGLTAYEAMCLGKCNLAIPWKSMSYYVDNMDKEGYLIKVENLKYKINLEAYLMDINKLNSVAKKAFDAINCDGIRKMANVIMEEYRRNE